jgi:hypothetical protein
MPKLKTETERDTRKIAMIILFIHRTGYINIKAYLHLPFTTPEHGGLHPPNHISPSLTPEHGGLHPPNQLLPAPHHQTKSIKVITIINGKH